MDLYKIDDAIYELEQAETNFANCERLADLYIIKEHFKKYPPVLRGLYDDVEEELNDIAPQYKKYIEIKQKYQMHELSESVVLNSLAGVCKEIVDFIQILYSSTDFPDERKIIAKTLNDLSKKYTE